MSMIDRQTDASAKLPVLTKIIIVAVLTPAILQLGPLTLSPSRIIFLFLVPFVFFRIVSGKYGGFLLSDFILIAFLGWFGLAMLINNPDKAVSFTGMNAVIALGGYFLARSSITNVETFRAALKFILLVVMVLLPFAIFEAVTNEFVIPKLISAIPGVRSVSDVGYDRRLGVARAQVVFAHPILFGMFNAIWVGAYLFAFKPVMSLNKRIFGGLIFTLSTMLSVSSGPLIGAIFGFGMLGYDWFFERNERRWKLLLWSSLAAYVILDILSNRPILYVISTKVALNAWTANYRLQQIYAGMKQVGMTPFFGVGLNDWERPAWMLASIDNYFLLIAIQGGVPCLALLLMLFLNCLFRGGKNGFKYNSELYWARIGWNVSLFATILVLCTVAIFGDIIPLMYFMIGSGCFLFYSHEPDEADRKVEERPKRRAIFGDMNHEGSKEEPVAKPAGATPKPPRAVPVLGRMT